MRNPSFAQPPTFARVLPYIAVAVLFIAAPSLRAQCTADDPTQLDCALQTAPLSAQQQDNSPDVLTVQQQAAQGTPRGDRASASSADNSLGAGSSYTERGAHGLPAKGLLAGRLVPVADAPTEFQSFVAATTGHSLSTYGADLFGAAPASFGPVDQAPAPEDLVVGSEDELRIRIWGQINFSANLRVSREGEIYLPKVGAIHVAGLPFSAVAGHLRTAIGRVYRNFELSVDMGEIHSIQIYVTGQARRPGEYTVSALSTLVDAIFVSGGPTGAGSMRHAELRRAGRVMTDFDLYALLVKGDKTGDVQLQPGDVLYYPPAGPQVALLGSVRTSAIFELRGPETIGEIVETAGGKTAVASSGRMTVERIEENAHRAVFSVAADATGIGTLLADGDIVRIDPIVSNYQQTVTLRGSLANPGRFRWREGMRLSDLMPDRDSLVSRDYWWRRTRLGLPAPELAPLAPADGRLDKPAVTSPAAQTNWSFATIERLDQATMSTSLISFNLGKLVLEHDSAQDLALRPGDVVTIFSQQDIRPPIGEQTKYVQLAGEFVHAGVYSVAPGETLRSLVARAGGFTASAYLYGSEFLRGSTRTLEQERTNEYVTRLEHQLARNALTQSMMPSLSAQLSGQRAQSAGADKNLISTMHPVRRLGRIVLNLRPHSAGTGELPEIPLEDGDSFLVPPVPATVQVIGAVNSESAYLYRSDARAADYLRLAGGMNRDADRSQVYILRADGSVVARDPRQPFFYAGIEDLRLYPGDTVVVPEKSPRMGALREFLLSTQMLGQASLTAASINAIK